MATTFTAKTVLEFAVMPVQKYEFTCSHCGIISSIKNGHYVSRQTQLCGDCIADWRKAIKR